jgi:hypothetical protein
MNLSHNPFGMISSKFIAKFNVGIEAPPTGTKGKLEVASPLLLAWLGNHFGGGNSSIFEGCSSSSSGKNSFFCGGSAKEPASANHVLLYPREKRGGGNSLGGNVPLQERRIGKLVFLTHFSQLHKLR